ncbi:hypothetical protein LOTGIDRAFT_229258 [Lottia gigantea]|uniref:SIPAR domain-containing protein n=1 Tax=Lottia gigantea TaxID=225164 RepID=V4BE48_LOTGI|nr:hypothetical protein LOTGIDRAFT_229258 [Lottia gigantea]ESO87089.1 hypothetical protein LOTGIDRAFT_229258 [Lottia gigantea]
MSRSVRDLRDLICVSRLTYRESDEEDVGSDQEEVTADLDALSLTSSGSDTPTTSLKDPSRAISPDSGFVTNGSPTESNSKQAAGSKPGSKKKRRKKLHTFPTRHDLPKSSPLPPLSSKQTNQPACASGKSSHDKGNFDQMMCFMDATVVSGWLTRATDSVDDLSKFCNANDNFVQFAHFWLSDFPDVQKQEIYELEFNILMEEIGLAFAAGRDNRQIVHRDVLNLVSALFREYPGKLVSSKGSHLFLNYLDIMSSTNEKDKYRKLLSDVRCSTRNRQYAQWLLAIRSFALVNVWTAITNFFRNLRGEPLNTTYPTSSAPPNVHQYRFSQAIRHDYIDVIHYLIVSGRVNPNYTDNHNRTCIFTAVMHNKPKVVQYLLHRVKPAIDINLPSDTGNTALHAAANTGHYSVVSELLSCPDIDINCKNMQCEQATPIHYAVMHGHVKVVELLLKSGADKNLKMGGLSNSMDIARDFGHIDILKMLLQ